jgi:uncharacterized membrane protein YeaQ/YmgE (transglycosylase-associated protein family)
MLFRIILGLIIAIIGALIVIKSEWVYQNFGPIPTFDKYLGAEGGSRLGWQIIGIIGCLIGFLVMTNLMYGVLMLIFTTLFPGTIQK